MCIISEQLWVVNRAVYNVILGKVFWWKRMFTSQPALLFCFIIFTFLLQSHVLHFHYCHRGISNAFSSLNPYFIPNCTPTLKQEEISRDLWCHTLKYEKEGNGAQVIKEDTRNYYPCAKTNKIYSQIFGIQCNRLNSTPASLYPPLLSDLGVTFLLLS